MLLSPDDGSAAVDEWVPVETYSISRVVADPHADAARLLKDRIARYRDRTWSVEFSYTPAALLNSLSSVSAADAGPLLRFCGKQR